MSTPTTVSSLAGLFAAALLLSPHALAQEPVSPPVEQKAPEIQALSLDEVASRAESLAAELLTMAPTESDTEALSKIDEELDRLKENIVSRVAGAQSALALLPSVQRLQGLEGQLTGLRDQLKVPDAALEKDLVELRVALDELEIAAATWKKTEAAARDEGASQATLRRIASTRRDIDRLRGELTSWRNKILTRRDSLVDPAASLDRTLAEVREAIAARIGGIFTLDRPPLWSPELAVSAREELSQGWTEQFAERRARLVRYLGDRQRVLILQMALFIGLALGLRALGLRARAQAEKSYGLGEAAQVFELPISMAAVITLVLVRQFHPLAPNLFVQLAVTALAFPTALIVYRLAPASMRPLVFALPVLFVADRCRDIMETLPTLQRLVLLVELVGALGFVFWLIRPSRLAGVPEELARTPFLRVVGTAMRVLVVLFSVAVFAEVVGLGNLVEIMGTAPLRSSYTALFIYALVKVLKSLVAYALVLRPLRLLRLVSRNRQLVRRHLDRGLRLLGLLTWISLTLSIFGMADPARSILSSVLGASLAVGAITISVENLVVFGITAWLSFVLARLVNFVLNEDVFSRMSLQRGVSYAVSSLVRYVLIFVGFLVALAAAGIQLSNLTVVAGGLGVGIGFGLQNVVNNFVSGLILLTERPVHVGDAVELHTQNLWGEIKHIGIRASVIRTWDGAEVIVPNGQLVSESVTNWTLSDRRRRLEVSVGVEYGTDAQRVIDLLVAVATEHSEVLDEPEPKALFVGFGDSSLDFLLRVWVGDFEGGFSVRSELAVAIQRALKEAQIGVPFPQRDLHLRTLSPGVASEIGRSSGVDARSKPGDSGETG